MKSGFHETGSNFNKDAQRLLLCVVFATLSFVFSQLTFQSSFYALSLSVIFALSLSMFTSGAWWSAADVSAAVITLFLLEGIFNADAPGSVPPGFMVYTGCLSVIAALLTNRLYRRLRRQRDSFEELSSRERTISHLSTALLTASSEDELYELTVRSVFGITGCPAVIFTRSRQGELQRMASFPKGLLLYPCDNVVNDCFSNSCRTGFGTPHHAENPLACLPVSSNGRVIAAVGILPNTDHAPNENQLKTAELLLVRAGVVLDRIYMLKREQQILMEKELEHMRSDFLRSISHDFRTPLTGIIGACSMLSGSNDIQLTSDARQELVESINGEAEWLMRTVENLLSVTRVGSSGPKLNKSQEPIEEVLSTVLEKASSRFPQSEIAVTPPDDFIMIPVDPVLIVQVLMNLIENAVKYSDSTDKIELKASDGGEYAVFTVRDHGRGMNQGTLDTLFEPSAGRSGDSTHGMGLGLSICKSIIQAHGGTIEGHNAPGGGAVFNVYLPKEDKNEQQ